MTVRILVGDALAMLKTLDAESVQCCVTSPPYWGLRDYGVVGQLGLEKTPDEYVGRMVEVFREVRRVLRKDGTLWLNIGDCYATNPKGSDGDKSTLTKQAKDAKRLRTTEQFRNRASAVSGTIKCKDLVGIPWMLAFALRADGWYLRSDIIWAKPNPMPESVGDRPTKAHEYLFLLSKSDRYFYDADAIAEPVIKGDAGSTFTEGKTGVNGNGRQQSAESRAIRTAGKHSTTEPQASGRRMVDNVKRARAAGAAHDSPFGNTRNKRSVWTVATRAYAEAHFATFPPKLIEPCILAGSPEGGTVLDPFGGAGTTGLVADLHNRDAVLIELNPAYAAMAEKRIQDSAPLFARVTA